jgi:hypothetical protein
VDGETTNDQVWRERSATSQAQRSVRGWLEEAWRHGEVVADVDGLLHEQPGLTGSDRFRTSYVGPPVPGRGSPRG